MESTMESWFLRETDCEQDTDHNCCRLRQLTGYTSRGLSGKMANLSPWPSWSNVITEAWTSFPRWSRCLSLWNHFLPCSHFQVIFALVSFQLDQQLNLSGKIISYFSEALCRMEMAVSKWAIPSRYHFRSKWMPSLLFMNCPFKPWVPPSVCGPIWLRTIFCSEGEFRRQLL